VSPTEENPPERAGTVKATPAPRRNRVVAPPPAQYIKDDGADMASNASSSKAAEQKGKMLYAYQSNGDGEISVADGRDISILEPDDGSGWTKIRAGALEGLVPAAYIEILPQTPPSSLATTNRPGSTYSASSVSLAGSITAPGKKKGPAVAPKRGAKKLKYVEALYDYKAQSDAEHTMAEGERFVLINMEAGEGWADVERGGLVKSVPANYIQQV